MIMTALYAHEQSTYLSSVLRATGLPSASVLACVTVQLLAQRRTCRRRIRDILALD